MTSPISPDQARTIGAELEQANALVVAKLANVKIATQADCQQAVIDRQELSERTKIVQAFFAPFKNMAHQLHKALCDRENEILGPILRLDGHLRDAISGYKSEQDRLRRLEEQRQAEERHQAEQTRLAAEAAALETSGDVEMAAAVIEQAITAPAPVVVLPDVTKSVEGLKFRRAWKWRPVNNDRARALQLIPRDYLALDDKKLDGYARSMKETARIPGIEFYYEDVPVR